MLLFDVATSPEAERLDGSLPAAHHRCIAVLTVRVRGDDQQQAVHHEQTVGLLTTQPALVWRREVLEEQGEDDHVEAVTRQPLYGTAQHRLQVGVDGVGGQLEGLHDVQLQEVTPVHTLKQHRATRVIIYMNRM